MRQDANLRGAKGDKRHYSDYLLPHYFTDVGDAPADIFVRTRSI
jgi:hypothetical protein